MSDTDNMPVKTFAEEKSHAEGGNSGYPAEPATAEGEMNLGGKAMDTTISYEAELEREYQVLTSKHETIKKDLEATLSSYLTERKGKPVTIQGPYGSGKTQLLYHLFKFTFREGGIGIYTHLEKIIPTEEMTSSDYANYLHELLDQEVQLLQKGESRLMSGRLGKVKDYAVSHINELNGNSNPIALFVDEIEQQYRLLDEKVKTDDHSPMKETLRAVERGDAGFYLVLAFAPVSFYEFSKGEAQTRSVLPIMLPVLKADNLRKAFGKVGNFVWWTGRGRYGWALKVYDAFSANIPDISGCAKKEFLDVCRNIGLIGDVPPLVFENIEAVDDFSGFRDFLICLEPKKEGGEIYSGDIKIVKKCRICSPKHNLDNLIEKALKGSKVSQVTDIAYYLSIILDALCTSDGEMPLFTDLDDWKELFNIVGDIILEFEGEGRLPWQDLEKLLSDSDFVFNIRCDAESIAPSEEGYCIAPSFLRILFPFPISSPNLTTKKIGEQRESLGDQTYLGREERDNTSVFFFLNEDKIREYLLQETRNFLSETKALVAVNLGEKEEFDLPRLAQWLRKEGRLKIITPRGILSDFLVSFSYWIRSERGTALPITGLFQRLLENQVIPERDKARKIRYYNSRIKEFLEGELPSFPAAKYTVRDKTGFDPKIGFASEVMGFAFVDNKNDWQAIHKFRKEFEGTQFVSSESTRKQTGVPTALESLVVETKGTKTLSLGAVLKRVNDSFSKHLPDLRDVVDDLSKDEFTTIPIDEASQLIFEGIYLYLKEWKDLSKANEKLSEAKSNWGTLVSRINKLSEKILAFEKSVDENIQLAHILERDKGEIMNIGRVLEEYGTMISPYTKFLLSLFVDKTNAVIEPKLNELEKHLQQFQDDVEDEIKRYRSNLESTHTFEKDTFDWINKTEEEVQEEFQQKLKNVCQELTQGGKLDLENVPDVTDFVKSLEEIADELQILGEIDENMKQCRAKAEEINTKLRAWEAK
jgi:hypothetical protein